MDLLSAARKRGFNGNSTSAIERFEGGSGSGPISGARIPILTRSTLNENTPNVKFRYGFDPAAMRGPNPANWTGAHSGNSRLMNVNAQLLAEQVMPEIDLSGSTLQLADFDLNYIDGLADFVAGLAIAAGVLNADGTLVSEGGSSGDSAALLAKITALQNDVRTSEARNATLTGELREARDYLDELHIKIAAVLGKLPASGGGKIVAPAVKSLREIALSIGAEIDRMSKID